jgi:hypothetical protein
MVIGGSNAQSYGVRDEESFVYILSKRYPQLWFENFGNGGYGTVQSLILAKRAYRDFYTTVKPKLILLAFDDSHALRNVSDQSWVYSISDEEGQYVAPPHYRVRDGSLVFYPFQTIGFWPLEKYSALITLLHNVWLQSFTYNTAGDALKVTQNVIAIQMLGCTLTWPTASELGWRAMSFHCWIHQILLNRGRGSEKNYIQRIACLYNCLCYDRCF